MTKPAARMTDMTAHGGTIVSGFPTVLIGGMPAARLGDSHVCPMFDGPKPHVGGVIITASATVEIGGANAARLGDMCGCPSVGTPGQAVPAVTGAPPVSWGDELDKEYFKDEGVRGPHAEAEMTDSDKDGTYDSIRGDAYLAKTEHKDHVDVMGEEFGGEHKLKLYYGSGSASMSVGHGVGASRGVEVGAAKESLKLWHGDEGDEGTNPDESVMVEGDLLHAEAKGDVLLGDDGRRIGLGASGKVGAEVVAGKVVVTDRIDPFGILEDFGLSLEVSGELGGEAVAAGVSAGAHAYYDRADERFKMGVMGKVAAVLGVEGKFDISFGKIRPVAGGGVPNPIATGEPTVLIGG